MENVAKAVWGSGSLGLQEVTGFRRLRTNGSSRKVQSDHPPEPLRGAPSEINARNAANPILSAIASSFVPDTGTTKSSAYRIGKNTERPRLVSAIEIDNG